MEETILRIRVFGDSVLRKKSRDVARVTSTHKETLSQMAQLMYARSGIGLAAPQVGIGQSMIVVDIGTGLYKVINPRIVKRVGHQAREEGCLSVPGVCIKIRRAKKIVVEGLDENAACVKLVAEDLLACVFQHEIDHLKGKLIVDYASFLDKLKVKKRLTELKRNAAHEELCESKSKSCKLQL